MMGYFFVVYSPVEYLTRYLDIDMPDKVKLLPSFTEKRQYSGNMMIARGGLWTSEDAGRVYSRCWKLIRRKCALVYGESVPPRSMCRTFEKDPEWQLHHYPIPPDPSLPLPQLPPLPFKQEKYQPFYQALESETSSDAQSFVDALFQEVLTPPPPPKPARMTLENISYTTLNESNDSVPGKHYDIHISNSRPETQHTVLCTWLETLEVLPTEIVPHQRYLAVHQQNSASMRAMVISVGLKIRMSWGLMAQLGNDTTPKKESTVMEDRITVKPQGLGQDRHSLHMPSHQS
ncbi:hypothetical protein K458DRAFT_397999 [Lentithecium fluviatile CBS 122367]|uniref:Uncharacterized protein n=1 Tax=Lentithecium fluviatile CBS 122367 TaxID=1168545 RepID=A0A6G1JM22_9PLEO|nr:hypothetical protein K458DRAFT_397999 [Lentithecium fluviatile CBS 122367]